MYLFAGKMPTRQRDLDLAWLSSVVTQAFQHIAVTLSGPPHQQARNAVRLSLRHSYFFAKEFLRQIFDVGLLAHTTFFTPDGACTATAILVVDVL